MVVNYKHKVPAPFFPFVLQGISLMDTPRLLIHTIELPDYQVVTVGSLDFLKSLVSH